MRNLRKKQNPDVQRSLFGEILDWMLAPLLFVWPISIAFTHYFANSVASFPYDQSLREHVAAISRQIDFDGGGMSLLRTRIREGSRFTVFDIDPVTARQWGEALLAWSQAQPGGGAEP